MTGGRIHSNEESSFRKTANILFPFLVYFVVHDLAQVLLAFLVNLSLGASGGAYREILARNSATVSGLLGGLSLAIGMAAVWPMAHRELKWAKVWMGDKGNRHTDSPGKAAVGAEYFFLAVFAASFALGVNLFMALTGLTQISESYREVAGRQHGVALGVGIFIYGFLSPLAEEIVFRGLIYNRMRRYFGKLLSVIVCGIMFGVYHGNAVQGIYGSILGIAITCSYEWMGTFFAPLLFHSIANVTVFLASSGRIVKGDMVTVPNCALFMAIALLDLYVLWKIARKT